MDARNLPGPLKVAILIQSLDQGAAQRIIGGLNDKERKLIHSHLNQMGPVAPVLIEKVAREFAQKIQQARNRRIGNGGQNKAAGKQIDGPKCPAGDGSNLKAVLSLAPDQLFELIKDEHPQTIAIVLVHLETAVASDILSKMPDDLKAEVAVRIAGLDKVSAGMVTEINCVFEEILKNKDTSVTRLTGGVERLAEILNQSDEHSSQLVLSQIEESDPDLAAQIKQMMFVFEDLVLVDDRGFQKVLRRVETAELAMALKAASQEVKDKVFRNMSARAGEMLTEEISNMGPVRMKDVSDAQQKITLIIQEMESKGELLVGGRRGEEFVT
ncbi:MAG: flagellar motor switch protein FliG [Desulfobacterales bacterium]